jgi:very-short-patch-repair endonuclease
MRPDVLVRHAGGYAYRRTLLARGATVRQLAAAVHAGRLARPRRGLYASPELPAAERHAAAHGGALTCAAALASASVWLRDPPGECVALLDQGHELGHPDCVNPPSVHRLREAPRFGVLDATTALLHFARCAPDDEAFACAVESCLALGLTSTRELAVATSRLPRARRHVLEWARSTAGSGLETIVRWRLHRCGVAAQSQVSIPGAGRVDLLIGDCLVVELDGRAHHDDPVAFRRDRERDAVVSLLGGTTLRFDGRSVLDSPDEVVSVILAAMERGLHVSRSLMRSSRATRRH